MYQFSRALYRELYPLIVRDLRETETEARRDVLDACERAFTRLAHDRHYFARPARSLFNDVRIHFPMTRQMRVYRVIDRFMSVASEYVEQREQEGVTIDGMPLCCHASTRKGTPCQRVPLPGSKYCPSHKHLDEDFVDGAAA
ncbi:MAG: hypothetical protein JOZ25_03065 [Actinobacteria bacterium]|nr:hypothetical protein [Actinomycetota bacterium]